MKEEKKSKVILGGIDLTEKGRDYIWPVFLIFGGWNSKIKERNGKGPTFKISGSAVFGGVEIKG